MKRLRIVGEEVQINHGFSYVDILTMVLVTSVRLDNLYFVLRKKGVLRTGTGNLCSPIFRRFVTSIYNHSVHSNIFLFIWVF